MLNWLRVRQGADPDGEVGRDGNQREELTDRSAGEVEGHGWSGNVGDVRVHDPLMRHEEKEHALDDDASEQVSRRRPALRLPLGALGGDPFEQSDIVRFTDRKRHHHPSVDVAPRFARLLLVQRHRNECPQDEVLDALVRGSGAARR